jgi:glycosyltransferase involved in cell wall biosynthesis
MRKVLFVNQDRWVMGQIHRSLEKELFSYGIYANLLNWRNETKPVEWQMLNDTYDLFLTNPDAVQPLSNYGIPLEKIATIAHGQWDMLLAQQQSNNFDFYPQLYKFGVVSQVLKDKCAEHKISTRVPEVVREGLHFDFFYKKPAKKLAKVGYGGAEAKNFFGTEIKRRHLVKHVIGHTPLQLVEHDFYHWFSMPAYYNSIDALVASSIEEAAGFPVMEAAAAGRLVLSTPVGYFEEDGPKGGGIVLPLEENAYCQSLYENLAHYHNNPDDYHKKCCEIQEYARENYDWSRHIEKWVEFLS